MGDWKKDVAWLLVALLIVVGFEYGLRLALHTDTPLVIVISGSMEPVFYKGDVVVLKGVNPDSIHVGNVIVYKRPGFEYPIIHRVRYIGTLNLNGKTERCFVTWGDNNPVPDPAYPLKNGGYSSITMYIKGFGYYDAGCVPASDVEAKAVFVIPKVGWIPLWLREHL